ncbi:unnamed protein product [Schistocephalus solidus]|uniref:Secreted protein n=1 Tax=Schistocephalus solidus TaxID=70667 RepID=A0A183TLR3_SCHSO|nr:unnamed protein product [Schistocephalus solidus]
MQHRHSSLTAAAAAAAAAAARPTLHPSSRLTGCATAAAPTANCRSLRHVYPFRCMSNLKEAADTVAALEIKAPQSGSAQACARLRTR